jgi:hypothetical protein
MNRNFVIDADRPTSEVVPTAARQAVVNPRSALVTAPMVIPNAVRTDVPKTVVQPSVAMPPWRHFASKSGIFTP